jgi:murein DD-endopeptidase MepM/ murein hydrolase activator NlpD
VARRSRLAWLWRLALVGWLLSAPLALPQTTQAQSDLPTGSAPRAYTVAAGDTLFLIAQRLGIPLDDLAAFNGITDPNLLNVGQVLLIPVAGSAAADLPGADLPGAEVARVRALPGDTLASIAARLGQPTATLASLNGLEETARLFPGQPVYIPRAAQPGEALRFGAVSAVAAPTQIVQGRTASVIVTSRRPVPLQASWNDLPLTFVPLPDDPARAFAYLPAPALIAPASYWLSVAYTAGNGLRLNQAWPVAVTAGPYESQDIVLPPDRGDTLDPAVVQPEEELVAAVWAQRSPTLLWTAPFTRPIAVDYPTTSPFGTRRSYNGGPINTYHAGQDFGAPEGVPILVPGDGVVVLAEPLAVRGGSVIIDHGAGVLTGYWHLSQISVAIGQPVAAGDVLGLVGNTGRSTGAHLHWEMRIYGIAVDPMQFLEIPLLAPQ